MNKENYDFCGWATKNNIRCSDGRVIRTNAFKESDGKIVPIVWNHQHNNVEEVLGHALLENREDGVYAYGFFNDTPKGNHAKKCVLHGDVTSMSIWANNLQQNGPDVNKGTIREVSLVVAGANPGAFIESVVAHGEPMDDYDEEGIFYTDENLFVSHAIEKSSEEDTKEEPEENNKKEEKEMASEKTVQDVIDTMNEEQKNVMYALIGSAIEEYQNKNDNDEEDEEEMKHNIFSDDYDSGNYLSHSDMVQLISDAKRIGSLRDAVNQTFGEDVIMHSIDTTGMTTATGQEKYGFNDPNMLFPEFRALSNAPEWISRNMDWVTKVMNGVHKTPFSRIKSMYANITEDDARARGYIKGKQKKEEVFTTLKRTTSPQTIYKLQKMDRDDILDITDMDVVAWIKAEMRVMLNEEIARACLIGDDRQTDSEEHIKEDCIRPIAKDVPLFNTTILVEVDENATQEQISRAIINAAVRSRKNYKGSGNPTFWTTEDVLTEMLLLEDAIDHKIYKTETEVATALRVKDIVTVEPMENKQIEYQGQKYPLIGIIVNPADYNIGADKGGQVSMFDDFDIDFNQQKYLIETRISGALIKPYSAITLLLKKKQS